MSEKKVVAKEGLVADAPWQLRKSKRHEGRCYFYNTDTKESAWSLPQSIVRKEESNEEPDEPPPDFKSPTMTSTVNHGQVQLPVLSPNNGSSPDHPPQEGPIIPTVSAIHGAWGGGGTDGIMSGRYRRGSFTGSSMRNSVGSSESDLSPLSAATAPADHIHIKKFDTKSPPQLNHPWDSPLFYRHQNRGATDSPNNNLSTNPSSSSGQLGGATSSKTSLLSRTNIGRSISTQSFSTPPISMLSPVSAQRKLISGDNRPFESPRISPRSPRLSPRTTSTPGPPLSTPPINRKVFNKSKSVENFSQFDTAQRSPYKAKGAGSLLVNEESERLRLTSTHSTCSSTESPLNVPLSSSESNLPYFAIGPPMLSPNMSPCLQPIRRGSGGGMCISEPPIDELDISSPPPLTLTVSKMSISSSQASSVEEEEEEDNEDNSKSPTLSITPKSQDDDTDHGNSRTSSLKQEQHRIDVDLESRFKVTNGLGSGGYSVVVLVEDSETLQPYAMKVIQKSRIVRSHDKKRIRNELKVLKELTPCPFIEKCVSAFESRQRIFFVMEFNSGGDLFFHLVKRVNANNTGFKEREVRLLLAEVLLGLEHLHKHGYVHRDIKVENIMLDSRGHIKLIDFGLVYELKEGSELLTEGALGEPMSPTGSLIYMAPELLDHRKGGRHTDWWAFGVLAHELLTGRTPWSSLTNKKVIQKEISGMRVSPPSGISPAAGMFICSLLRQDPFHRLGTSTSVRTASFFSPIDWNVAEKLGLPPALPPSSTNVIYGGSAGSSFDKEESAEVLNTYLSSCESPLEESMISRDSRSSRSSGGRSAVPVEKLFSLGLPRVSQSPALVSPNREDPFAWDDEEEDLSRRRQSSVTGGDSWPTAK